MKIHREHRFGSSGPTKAIRKYTQLTVTFALIAAASFVFSATQYAASTPLQSAALSQPMPVDPQITIGKLPNGLRYYIRANKKPEKRAELRLASKAGSILEDDDQQGM